jgi:hypothetical protein
MFMKFSKGKETNFLLQNFGENPIQITFISDNY